MRAVVIGTGPAGITAAETLRRLDPTGTVVALVGRGQPAVLATRHGRPLPDRSGGAPLLEGSGRRRTSGGEERRGARVAGLDTDTREVVLADGGRIPYEGLVVASGSRLYAPLEGAERPGVLDFKSLRSATTIVDRVRRGEVATALIVGNGFIGVELSLLLADLGVDVAIIGRRNWVMPRVLDPLASKLAEGALAARGVTLRLGVEAHRHRRRSVGDRGAAGRWDGARGPI